MYTPTLKELLQDANSGLTINQVADKYKVTYQCAYMWFKNNGIKINKPTVDPPPVIELIDMLKHFSKAEVAEMYGVTTNMCISWRKHYGLMKGTNPRKHSLPEEVFDYAMQNYFLGLWDEADISDEYNIPLNSVEAAIKDYGKTEDMVDLMPDRKELIEESRKMTIQELAKWYGTSQHQIFKWFKALAIKEGVNQNGMES